MLIPRATSKKITQNRKRDNRIHSRKYFFNIKDGIMEEGGRMKCIRHRENNAIQR